MKSSFTVIFTFFIASFMVAQTGSFWMADLEYGLPTQTVTIKDDIKIAYSDQGKGSETILFIHGLASYIPAWKNNVSALQADYRCIAIDLPG